ncbi:hypothetical protein J1N10_19925 [Carboxylicivirga sp. A043]|uniref:hypothetical protein n=1 Tax=Carboxylicivirga litoralis TaxID=2816963 RepID=UPI0021CAF6BF|nr:hypothetical protein [Carboxylicivirga sp. A043]MCU4158252.1 hypothetical protein [Carboxylicivirga sp. A043]
MGKFTKITHQTNLTPGTQIRRPNSSGEYEYYLIGEHIMADNKYEVYPGGKDYLQTGILLYYRLQDMINQNCEYWAD